MLLADYATQLVRKAFQKENRAALTTEISTEFLRPAVKGDKILVIVQGLHYTEERCVATMEIRKDPSQELLTTGYHIMGLSLIHI